MDAALWDGCRTQLAHDPCRISWDLPLPTLRREDSLLLHSPFLKELFPEGHPTSPDSVLSEPGVDLNHERHQGITSPQAKRLQWHGSYLT